MKTALLSVALWSLTSGAVAYDLIKFREAIKGPEMARPVAASSSVDRLYVVDEKKNALLIYDASGKFLKSVGGPGDKPAFFSEPRGVAVGPAGKVYVADAGHNRIQIFDRDGAFVYAFGEKGSEAGRLRNPQSIALGADGRIYVADTGNDRVQVFTEEGILLYQIGAPGKLPGQLRKPTRVAVDSADQVYVVDAGNDRVQKFDAAARVMREFSLNGNDLAVDAYGFLYFLDGRNGKVIEESPEGQPIGKFGSYGNGVGQMKKSEGIAIAADGAILVMDTGNSRIQRIELTNKLKTTLVPINAASKLSVTGPSREWPVTANVLAAHGDSMYAYLPQGGPFVELGPNGGVKRHFGTAKGKGGDVTRSSGGLAISDKLGIFTSDTPGNRLQKFSIEGKWQANIGESTGFFDSKSREGRMIRPSGVAINDDGTIYVADTGNRRIDAFSPEGVFVFSIGPKVGSYELQEPVAVAWDKAGFLYFVDKTLKKVFKCEPSGAFLAAWGEEGSGAGQFSAPVSIAFDGENYLYTLDGELKRVSVHTRDGKWLTDFFAAGRAERELTAPSAIAIQGQRLVISDKGKGKVVSFDLHPLLAAPAGLVNATREGTVSLSWAAVLDPWQAGYQVFRSSQPGGPFVAIGTATDEKYTDSEVTALQKYWYRVATVSKTKDVGPRGRAIEVTVAGANNRAPIEISTVTIGNIFAANYKWYLKHPMGKVTVTNNTNVPFLKVKVTFKLKDYMDFGFDTEIARLEPKQVVEIPLSATLNNRVLEVTEDTPIQAEFSLNYYQNEEPKSVSLTKPLRLYSRNAITWDDTRKLANFITYKDTPLKDFKAAVSADYKNRKASALNPNVLKAMRLWNAIGEYGVKFAANPANPFETAHDDPNFPVDYTQYPRDTLKRRTGQCSDLTSLYAALLQDNEVRVAMLDYPGHITLMFDTEAEDAADAGLANDMLVEHGGSLWAPIEVTYIGKPFDEALSKGAYAYKAEAEKNRVKIIDVEKAFEEYEPVSMPATEFTPALPDATALEKRYDAQVAILAKQRHSALKKALGDKLKKNPQDTELRVQLGLADLQYGDSEAATAQFKKVIAADPKNAAALNNLASVAFLIGDFVSAEQKYLQASQNAASDGDVWLNLTKTALKLKQDDKARQYGAKAAAATPAYKPYVASLLNGLKEE